MADRTPTIPTLYLTPASESVRQRARKRARVVCVGWYVAHSATLDRSARASQSSLPDRFVCTATRRTCRA